jgi:hypothetical protein
MQDRNPERVRDQNAVLDPNDCRICEEVIEVGDRVATIPTGNASYQRQKMEAMEDCFTLHMSTDGTGEVFHAECLYSQLGLLSGDSDE